MDPTQRLQLASTLLLIARSTDCQQQLKAVSLQLPKIKLTGQSDQAFNTVIDIRNQLVKKLR